MTDSAKCLFNEVFHQEDLWTPEFFNRPLAEWERLWEEPGTGALLTVETAERLYLSLLAVHPDRHRSGVAKRLVTRALDSQQKPVQVGAAPGRYLFPGLDSKAYPAAEHFFNILRFRDKSIAHSMEISLGDGSKELPEWIRVPTELDRQALADRVFTEFGVEWRNIVLCAPLHQLLVATLVDEWVGFSHWDGERFGPIGVFKEFRGRHLGFDLSLATLNHIQSAGYHRAFFMWANHDLAKNFYSHLGFTVRRTFQILERP